MASSTGVAAIRLRGGWASAKGARAPSPVKASGGGCLGARYARASSQRIDARPRRPRLPARRRPVATANKVRFASGRVDPELEALVRVAVIDVFRRKSPTSRMATSEATLRCDPSFRSVPAGRTGGRRLPSRYQTSWHEIRPRGAAPRCGRHLHTPEHNSRATEWKPYRQTNQLALVIRRRRRVELRDQEDVIVSWPPVPAMGLVTSAALGCPTRNLPPLG